jgi:hypothetical protein
MIRSFDLVARTSRFGTTALVLMLVGGCGYAQYEERLNESKNYYAHLDKLEQNLAVKWTAPQNLMELRVPRQFSPIPPPPPPPAAKDKDEAVAEQPQIDQRQPDYLNLKFPGLFGAWEATFKVQHDGAAEDRKGYIYALSNYWELAGDHAVDAGEFVNNLKALLTEQLRITPTDGGSEIHPKGVPAYQPPNTYDVCAFKEKEIEGLKYTFEVYSRTQGSVIGVIVVVLPPGVDAQQKINERLTLMLGTFNFTRTPPKANADPNAGAQGNPGAAASPF